MNSLLLRRLGSKNRLADKILQYFPEHKLYIEPFFGAGGIFFNKPKAQYNILNDLDSDVYNLFMVVMNKKDELIKQFIQMPIHEDLFKYWKNNKETDPIRKALRFLFLSNYGFYGIGRTLKFESTNTSKILLDNIEETQKYLFGCQFMNTDFRNVLKKIAFRQIEQKDETFIYCDPPYLDTENNYEYSFTKKDNEDLFKMLIDSKCKFAISEFNNPFILEQAKKYGLTINVIGERQTIKNRQTEILITNYQSKSPFYQFKLPF